MVIVDPEIMETIIRLKLQEGRTLRSLSDEFGLSEHVVRRIIENYRKECQKNKTEAENKSAMEEIRRLKELNEELQKENDFLKKAAAFFAKESK